MTTKQSQTQKAKLIQEILSKYINAQLQGDLEIASQIIKKGLRSGLSILDIYLKVLTPAQHHIGELWFKKKISVSEEHLASQFTLKQMTMLRQIMVPKSPLGLKAIVTTLEEDWHILGARIFSDFLYEDGWDVDFLGASTPARDLLYFIEKRAPDLVAISITLEEVVPKLKEIHQGLQKLKNRPKLLLGGYLFQKTPAFLDKLEADGYALDAVTAIQEARRICKVADSPPSLQHFLKKLGERIQTLRKSKGLSQKELAEAASLDRAYISALEHGKQNVTIGAIIKLADALGITLEEALVGSPKDLSEHITHFGSY